MTDREAELRELVEELCEHEPVDDAFVAKSFTDRLVVVDLHHNEPLPESVEQSLQDHRLRGANSVYATGDTDQSFTGMVGDATRHQFVDMQTRGDHQSYVVD